MFFMSKMFDWMYYFITFEIINSPLVYCKSPGLTHLLLLRFMTLSFCMSPISSGKDSSLLEWRKSTVAFFQLPICNGKEQSLLSKQNTATLDLRKHTRLCNVHANLRGKLDKEVVICSKGADAHALANGGGQAFDLIEAAVQFIQTCQPDTREGLHTLIVYYLLLWICQLTLQCLHLKLPLMSPKLIWKECSGVEWIQPELYML